MATPIQSKGGGASSTSPSAVGSGRGSGSGNAPLSTASKLRWRERRVWDNLEGCEGR